MGGPNSLPGRGPVLSVMTGLGPVMKNVQILLTNRLILMPMGPSPTIFASGYSAARFGVNSSGNPLWPVSLSPSSYISNARFFKAGRTEAILSRSRSAAIPG